MNLPEAPFSRAALFVLAVAMAAVLAQPCQAQVGLATTGPSPQPVTSPLAPPEPAAPVTASSAEPEPAAPEPAAPEPAPQGTIANIGERVKVYSRNAPEREDRVHIGLGTDHVNAVIGGMGQGGGFGFGVHLTTADAIPGVELQAAAITSTKLYRILEAEAYFPEVGNEDTHADVRFRYRRRTKDNFFGLGPNVGEVFLIGTDPRFPNGVTILPPFTSEGLETNYDLEERQLSGSFFHDFTEDVEAGVYVDYNSSSTYVGDDDKDPPINAFFFPQGQPFYPRAEAAPGVFLTRIPVPGLFTGSKILSEGVYIEYDARNEAGTSGFYGYARLSNSDGIGDIEAPRFIGSFPFPDPFEDEFVGDLNDFGWVSATLDARGYIPFGDRLTLALRYFSQLNEPKGGSQIPFYNLARLGGRSTLRGFDTFRFSGENSILFQGELRVTAWQQDDDSGVDVAVFGDTGQVWGLGLGENSIVNVFDIDREYDDLDFDNFEADFGGALIYRYNKDFLVRLDVAHSNEGTKVWFSFNQVF